jgi:hypothetical protein
MTNLKNPKEKIYLMLFEKPLNLSIISNRLYGKLNTKISSYLTELESDGWIEYKRDYYRFKKGEKKDTRKNYYQSTSKGIIDSISQDIQLNETEKQTLWDFFKNSYVKDYIKDILVYDINLKKENNPFKIIKQKIGLRCKFYEKTSLYYKQKTGIDKTNSEWIKESQEINKIYFKNSDRVREHLEWDKLGLKLLSKLSVLLSPLDVDLDFYLDCLIMFVEFNKEQRLVDLNGSLSNGNSHGLS